LPAPATPAFAGATQDEILEGIAVDPATGDIMVVGYDAGSNYVAYHYDQSDAAWSYSGNKLPAGGAITLTDSLTDVAYTGMNYVLVGFNVASHGVSYYVAQTDCENDVTNTNAGMSKAVAGTAFRAVDWAPDMTYGLIVGHGSGIHYIDSTAANLSAPFPSLLWTQDSTFHDVDFSIYIGGGGEMEAMIVGEDSSGNALVYQWTDAGLSPAITEIPDVGAVMGANPLWCVGYKPYGSPRLAIACGAAGQGYIVHNIQSGQPITTSTLYPHIDDLDIFIYHGTAGETVVDNQRVDVDSGAGTEIVSIRVRGRHNDGWASVGTMDLWLWHDGGDVGANSVANRPLDANPTDNTHIHLVYTNGGATVDANPGNNEIVLVDGSDETLSGTERYVWFNITFGEQAWASTNAAMNPAADQTTPAGGLNDANTWDVHARINGATGGDESRYDELGVYIYEEFTSAGLPGQYSGSGPPGSIIDLTTGGNAFATFSANYNYRFGVYITDDMFGLNNPTNFIDVDGGGAGNDGLRVGGGGNIPADTDIYFASTGYGGIIYLLGDGGGGPAWITPNGAQTTTDCGNGANPAQNGAANVDIDFDCEVGAAIPEDNYVGTLVYILEHQ